MMCSTLPGMIGELKDDDYNHKSDDHGYDEDHYDDKGYEENNLARND